MAFIKYFVSVDNITIAMKYDLARKELIIGGFSKFSEIMEIAITKYFRLERTTPSFIQSNKMKYVVPCSQTVFTEGKQLMTEHGFNITQTSNLQSIMR